MKNSKYEILLKAVETGSLTKTAEYFNYTQSAISQGVKSLEEELRVELLSRKNRTISLTKDGEYLLPIIREIVVGERHLLDKTSEIQNLQRGIIRIGAFTSMSCHWLPKYLSTFRDRYPNLRFEMKQGDYEQLSQWLREGTVDMLIMMKSTTNEFDFIKLFEDSMCVILPEGHRLAKRKVIGAKELKGEHFILPESDYREILKKMFKENQMNPRADFLVKEDYTIMAMVENGLGIGVLPELVLQRCPWKIKAVAFRKDVRRELGILTRKGEHVSWAVKKFIEFICDVSGV